MLSASVSQPTLMAGIELGGTKCVCTLACGPNRILDERRVATTEPGPTLAAIAAILTEWWSDARFSAIGVASFGPLDLDQSSGTFGHIINTPKPGWSGTDLLRSLRHFRVPIALNTDVNGAAFAEHRWGVARDVSSFVYITVGTGVGVGSIIEGRAVRGLGHSEAGHMVVPRSSGRDRRGICPFHENCVEGIASGPAIFARAGAAGETLSPDHEVWNDVVGALTGLLHNLVLTVAPQRIIIGGGVPNGQPQLLRRLREALPISLAGYAAGARIADQMDTYLAEPGLRDRAGPLGAIALALAAHI